MPDTNNQQIGWKAVSNTGVVAAGGAGAVGAWSATEINPVLVNQIQAEATIDRILEVVDAFKGDAPQGDDMTCVVVRMEDV